MEEQPQSQSNRYIIPTSILIAGVLIAGAVFLTKSGPPPAPTQTPGGGEQAASIEDIRPVSADDHILGDPNAPVKIVEFSDLECPFCKRIHPTLKQVIQEYGTDGRVAWVYRHFPLVSLHTKAPKAAEASECAAELGGNFGFWAYIDHYFEVTPSNDQINLTQLPQIAVDVGLDRSDFTQCLDSGKYASKVDEQLNDAISSGGEGTPYSVVIAPNGQKFPVSGSVPYEQLKAIVDQALQLQ